MEQAHNNGAHVQAPRDEGGGNVRAVDICHDIVPTIEHADQHEVQHDNDPGEDVDDTEMNNKEDKTASDDTEGGEVVPTSDNAKAEDLKFMMPKISLSARRGGGHNETCGCAHFILVAKSALPGPRDPANVHLFADAPIDNSS